MKVIDVISRLQAEKAGLTPAQMEVLICLCEELGEAMREMSEAQQLIFKTLRHGPDSRPPAHPDWPSNKEALERELGHVLYWMHRLAAEEHLSEENIHASAREKEKTVSQFLHFNS